LIARFNAASPCVGVLIDAHLVELRRIDSVEPVRHIGQLNGATVPNDRASGEALARRESTQYQRRSWEGS
jgi:hypothetical protein